MVYYPDLICIPPTRLFLGRNIVGDGRARGDKDRLRDCTSGFGAQMRLERGRHCQLNATQGAFLRPARLSRGRPIGKQGPSDPSRRATNTTSIPRTAKLTMPTVRSPKHVLDAERR
jgi:hypothetical protein